MFTESFGSLFKSHKAIFGKCFFAYRDLIGEMTAEEVQHGILFDAILDKVKLAVSVLSETSRLLRRGNG
jgi:hypothetical protein